MNDLEYLKKYYQGDINEALKQLKEGKPLQYIVGNVDFYGYIIEVNENVLIPRFETEELVSKVIKLIDNKKNIVDLGTGSGCIAITLSKKLNMEVDAVDISSKALEVAKKNASLNNAQVNFYLGDMLEPLNKKYDVIISNPPYISYSEEIMDIVKNNEPSIALYAKNDGLEFYDKILKDCSKYLNDKALIAFEIGYLQKEGITKLINKYLPNCKFRFEKDMQGKDRFVFIDYELS